MSDYAVASGLYKIGGGYMVDDTPGRANKSYQDKTDKVKDYLGPLLKLDYAAKMSSPTENSSMSKLEKDVLSAKKSVAYTTLNRSPLTTRENIYRPAV